jgi:DNA-binding SARP family transcriptional activator/tetratricopeptide (TPR) repeat protein
LSVERAGVVTLVRLLGEVDVLADGRPVDLGTPRQRCIVAVLALEAGQVVTTDRLVERTWGTDISPRTRTTLHSYISRLRAALADADGVSLVRRSGGYALMIDPTLATVDTRRWSELCADARDDERLAVPLLTEALALWRGEALTGLGGEWAGAERDRWERARLAAQLDLVETRLRHGQGTELAPELAGLAARHPYDERIARHYMVALHQAGRTADALQHYRDVHARLTEDLGIEPTAELKDAHRHLLLPGGIAGRQHESHRPDSTVATARDRSAAGPANGRRPAPVQATSARGGAPRTREVAPVAGTNRNCLPRDLPYFAGRADELAWLVDSADDHDTLHTVDGMAGVGKTAFAVHVSHLLADRFADGVLFVDLQGHSSGKTPLNAEETLDVLLGQLGVAPAEDAKAQWRAKTAVLRLLVVFDNAVDEAQVAPLLPTGPSLVIVTSRARLPGLAGARPLSLAVLPEVEAEAFFAHLVGADRAAAEPEAVAQIVGLCAGLPLALRLSGARLAHRTTWPIAHLSAQLTDARRRLPKLFADREVALAFRISYEQLTPVDQQLFCALGQHPGADADTAVLAAMSDRSPTNADDALQRLVDVHLAEEPVPGRYRQHDLLRQYARGLSDDRRMIEKMLDHYLMATTKAQTHVEAGGPEAEAAHTWLMAEHSNLLAATRCAAAEGHGAHAWQLAISLWHFLGRDSAGDSIELLERGLAMARETAEGGDGLLSTLLALAHWSAGHTSRAYDLLTASAKNHENTESHAHTLALLGLMELQRGAHARAAQLAQAAFDELADLAQLSPLGIDAKIITHWTRGVVRWLESSHKVALVHLRTAYALCEELGQLSPNDHVLTALARCLIELGAAEEALGHLRQACEVRQRIGDRDGEAEALTLIGTAHRVAGNADEALKPQHAALTMLDDDARLQAHARIEYGRTHAALGNRTEAIRQHELALAIATQGDHLHEQVQAHDELARTHAGDDPRARKHQQAAAEVATRLDLKCPRSLPHLRPAGW